MRVGLTVTYWNKCLAASTVFISCILFYGNIYATGHKGTESEKGIIWD